MKKTITLLSVFAAITGITVLSSNSSGPATNFSGNRTGGPLSVSTCNGCHSGGPTGTTAAVSLKEKTSGIAAGGQYKPGMVYTVTVSGTHPSLNLFGFQLSALNSTNANAGTFSNLGSNQHTHTGTGITLVEQHHTLSGSSGTFSTTFDWTAPASGTGTVSFFAALNAVNGNGNTSGDAPSAGTSLVLTEASGTGVGEMQSVIASVYPNPAVTELNIRTSVALPAGTTATVFSIEGKSVLQLALSGSETVADISQLQSGLYFIYLQHEGKSFNMPFMKQ